MQSQLRRWKKIGGIKSDIVNLVFNKAARNPGTTGLVSSVTKIEYTRKSLDKGYCGKEEKKKLTKEKSKLKKVGVEIDSSSDSKFF